MTPPTSIVKLEIETARSVLSSWTAVAPCLTVKHHPDLSFGDRDISVHYEILVFAVYLNDSLGL